jgi:hypothetical protein
MTPNSALNTLLAGHGAICDAGLAPCRKCEKEHEAAEVIRALIAAAATKPKVVDGEVTERHREAAARFAENRDSGDIDELATLICAAESRGFAAGRASAAQYPDFVATAADLFDSPDALNIEEALRKAFQAGRASVTAKKAPCTCGAASEPDYSRGDCVPPCPRAVDPTLPAPPAPADTEPAKDAG